MKLHMLVITAWTYINHVLRIRFQNLSQSVAVNVIPFFQYGQLIL
jgi:hypothetical protein